MVFIPETALVMLRQIAAFVPLEGPKMVLGAACRLLLNICTQPAASKHGKRRGVAGPPGYLALQELQLTQDLGVSQIRYLAR